MNGFWKALHVSDMYRNAQCITVVVQSKEPRNQSLQAFNVQTKIPFTVWLDEDETQEFHDEDCIPVLECWTFLYHFFPPRLLNAIIVWSFNVQESIFLELCQSQSSHLVTILCSCELQGLQKGVASTWWRNPSLCHHTGPSRSLQVVIIRFPHCHLNVQVTQHCYKLIISMWVRTVLLCELGKCKQWYIKCYNWYLFRIEKFRSPVHHSHPMFDHRCCSCLLIEKKVTAA